MQNYGPTNQGGSSMSKRQKATFSSLASFWYFFSQFKVQIVLVATVFIVAVASLNTIPLLIGQLVGALTNHQSPWLFVILLGAASIIHDILWQVANIAYRKHILPVSFHYETLLFQQVLNHSYHYFTDKFTGKLSSHVTTISQGFRELLTEAFFNYTSQIITLIAIIITLGTVNMPTVLFFLGCLTIMFFVGRITVRNAISSERVETDISSSKNGHIVDSISNYPSVKSFFKEYSELRYLMTQQAKTLDAATRAFNYNRIFWWSLGLIVRWIFWPVAITMNVVFYLNGDLSLGQLATLLSSALLFTTIIWEVIWSMSQFSVKIARIEEAHTYLFGKERLRLRDFQQTPIDTPSISDTIQLKKISFAYPDKPEDNVLKDISLTITHGQKIGVVGRSGSGKSTLTKLLLGYYEQTAGEIIVDGKPVLSKQLAQAIAYVPQDTALFHRSIADNIAYAAMRDVSQDEIVNAAKQANADDFIRNIKDGYGALVGERGAKLSGGQRQRVAIARAIIKDAPLLVLDEATSALDSESEVLVQQALEKLWQNKTAIVIAHRLSTIAKLDRIIVMENGSIIEDGTHEKLIKRNGTYAKLWSHQSGGFIEE